MAVKLLLLGPSDDLIDYLDEQDVEFEVCPTVEAVLAHLNTADSCSLALAYCESTFGWVVSRQLPKIAGVDRTFVIVEDGSVYGDTDKICLQVANALHADAFLDVSKPKAVEWLKDVVSAV